MSEAERKIRFGSSRMELELQARGRNLIPSHNNKGKVEVGEKILLASRKK